MKRSYFSSSIKAFLSSLHDLINLTRQYFYQLRWVIGLILIAGSSSFLGSCNRSSYDPEWFVFEPSEDYSGSVINMSEWLDKPAGNHGFLKMENGDFVFEDGKRMKFWGVNICSQRPYSEKEKVDKWVDFLSAHGINAVRFHKYTSHGLKGNTSTQIVPELADKMDYFQYKLREKGIYYGWSPIYGHKVKPGDKGRLVAYDEIAAADMNSHLSRSTIGLVNFAGDVQDLQIELLTNLLNHKNPYTGLRYADDPALLFIEIQNEDNIWFATLDRMLELCPTYKKMLTREFTGWLREKYGNQKGLLNAWGKEAFEWGKEVRKTAWDLDKGNICPVAHQGIFGYEYQKACTNDELMPLFLRDMAYFLYLRQQEFYDKASAAIRKTGYKGTIIGSCWQAGEGITHFYNLYADYVTGVIDRHNYFGGGTGHQLVPGKFSNKAMVSAPGSGLLSTGRQAVDDRPFQISEWMSLPPNEWIAEGAPLIAIYGLGLQGWDASYSFAVDYPGFTNTIHTPGVYNVTTPSQISLYPALSAMITRNEIKEGKVVARRNVHFPSLYEGKVGFNENVKQDRDRKMFSGGVPSESLAAGKVVIDFTDGSTETVQPDLSAYWDSTKKIVTSSTGQLTWDYSGEGYFTATTPYSRVLTGFSGNKKLSLGDVQVQTPNKFSVIILSSLDQKLDLEESNKALLTTIARTKNTGMKFNEDRSEIVDVGNAPVLMEPVNLSLSFGKREIKEINVLDHSGKRTGKKIDVNSKKVYIDGEKYKSFYYEIIFK